MFYTGPWGHAHNSVMLFSCLHPRNFYVPPSFVLVDVAACRTPDSGGFEEDA